MLKKLELPSTTRVDVSQRFEARAGETLSFNFVVRLISRNRFDANNSAIRAVVINLRTDTVDSLVSRTVDGCDIARQSGEALRIRESQAFTFPTGGRFELRFKTSLDRNHLGSETHLLVNSVRVLDGAGNELRRLASLSCVGRVRLAKSDEDV